MARGTACTPHRPARRPTVTQLHCRSGRRQGNNGGRIADVLFNKWNPEHEDRQVRAPNTGVGDHRLSGRPGMTVMRYRSTTLSSYRRVTWVSVILKFRRTLTDVNDRDRCEILRNPDKSGAPRGSGGYARELITCCIRVWSLNPYSDRSWPQPEGLNPPCGISVTIGMCVLTYTQPKSSRRVIRIARPWSRVQTLEASP